MTDLRQTPLHSFHLRAGARMVPFAGYELPVQYPQGISAEHSWTRNHASLFDVSHMGQVVIEPLDGSTESAALAIETIVPGDIAGLPICRQTYSVLTNEDGGILDDVMISNWGGSFVVVVNAARKNQVIEYIREALMHACSVREATDRAMIAIQGPTVQSVLEKFLPQSVKLKFMGVTAESFHGRSLWVARSGYTGEDGFEISAPADIVQLLAERLNAEDEVRPAGLGARDTLRLEAGLCLHGSDIDATTNPVEASIAWTIAKSRRSGGKRSGGYPGAGHIEAVLADGASRRRVGLKPEKRAPLRAGTVLYADEDGSNKIGMITSGGVIPDYGPLSMGYVAEKFAAVGTSFFGMQRNKFWPVSVIKLPVITKRYKH